MKISVQVKLRAKEERVELIAKNSFQVFVRAQPVENQANIRVVELLAQHFGIPKSKIRIVQGLKSKNKVVEIS